MSETLAGESSVWNLSGRSALGRARRDARLCHPLIPAPKHGKQLVSDRIGSGLYDCQRLDDVTGAEDFLAATCMKCTLIKKLSGQLKGKVRSEFPSRHVGMTSGHSERSHLQRRMREFHIRRTEGHNLRSYSKQLHAR